VTDAAPTASATPEKRSKLRAAGHDAGEWLFGVLLSPFVEISGLFKLLWEALFWGVRPPYRGRLFVEAMEFIGIGSIFLVSLTAVFVGGVLALQLVDGFRDFGAENQTGAAHKLPAQLSGGMQKRVAVARAMILESEILIYDEPTTGLDPITTEMVDDLITEAEEMFGVTSIVISHDMASVVRIADHLSFLHQGQIAATGTTEELIHSEHPATAEFVRASRISLD
jgi:hypothetical protein